MYRAVRAVARGRLEHRGLLGRELVVHATAVLDHERGVEDQPPQPVGDDLRHPADHRAAEAVADQHDVAEIAPLDEADHRGDVVGVADAGAVRPGKWPGYVGAYAMWPRSRRHHAVGSHAQPPCQDPCRRTNVSPRD